MSFRSEIEETLKLQSAKEKAESIENLALDLSESKTVAAEEIGEIAANLLKAVLVEQNEEVKRAMFDFLATAVRWHRINIFIDWDAVVVQLPHLKGDTLLYVFEMLGCSKDKNIFLF